VQAIIWKVSINVLIVQIGSWKQEVPLEKKEQNGIRPHTPKVKRVYKISWILPTKTRIALHYKRRWSKSCWKTIHKRMQQTWNFITLPKMEAIYFMLIFEKKKQINLYFLMQITFRKIKNKYTLENFNTLHHISRVRNVLIFLCTSRLN